jgi:hypothetical protein
MEVAEVFIACKKDIHYSRELILPQPALVRVVSGEVSIVTADAATAFLPAIRCCSTATSWAG